MPFQDRIPGLNVTSMNHWNHVACRAKRSMNSIVLDPGIKDMLVGDARDFLNSKSWYAVRGIPFRRGYLLVRIYLVATKQDLTLLFSSMGHQGLEKLA